MKKVAVHNLGCKVNSYELDVMVQTLREQGYEIVPFGSRADVYIINTCTVTNIADRKSRQMLHRAKKENPDSIVVAVGCYVETDEQEIENDPAVDLAIGTNRKGQIAAILSDYLRERERTTGAAKSSGVTHTDKTLQGRSMEDILNHPAFESMHLTAPGHTRAYIKIQDGCSQYCTYCIIPYARGTIRSRDPEEILEEIRGLAGRGVREAVLTGIHIGSYGLEKGLDPETELESLLRRISLIYGIRRIRLGSLEPRIMTEHFIRTIACLPKVCPHFHLSLQSGCDATLRRMNRHYTTEEYLRSVRLLRQYYDRPAITTDVITGFPGETAEEFAQSRRFCEKTGFYEMHVFPYSVRHGTAAANMPGQLSMRCRKERSNVLLELTRRQSDAYRESFIGQEQEILLEEAVVIDGRTWISGHTERYVECVEPEEVIRDRLGTSFEGEIIRAKAERRIPGTPYLALSPQLIHLSK